MNYKLFDGKPKATLIQRFDGSALLLSPRGEKLEFETGVTLHEIQAKAEQFGWVIAIHHLHEERAGKVG
jgi:hypothetical protein